MSTPAPLAGRRPPRVAVAVLAAHSFFYMFLGACVAADPADPWPTRRPAGEPVPARARAAETLPPPAEDAAALRARALSILRAASTDPEAVVRANAILAMGHSPQDLEPLVLSGLGDTNRGVRFVAAMAAGTHQACGIAHLLEPLLLDESDSVRAAAIFAMRRCGRAADPSPLAEMIRSQDPEVRGNAALVLAEMGNPSAIPMIRDALGVRMSRAGPARAAIVELQLAEALVRLGEESELEAIRAKLWVPVEQAELAAVAIEICGRLGDRNVVPNLVRFAEESGPAGQPAQPAEVRMTATWALARLEPTLASAAVPMEYAGSGQFQLRVQAALTLGEIGNPASLGTLSQLLGDERAQVRVAAAGAILQIVR